MGMRDLHNNITAELSSGIERKEIFQELCQKAPGNEARIAYAIGAVPIEEKRRKFLKFNATLTLLLVLNGIFCLLSELPIDFQEPTLFIALKTILPLIFCYFTFRFYGPVYRFIGAWSFLDLVETVLLSFSTPGNSFVPFRILIVFLVMILSWYIARQVFPTLGIIGPKKGSDGNYRV